MKKLNTLSAICKRIEEIIFANLNVEVEITARTADRWTISGSETDADRAASWLVINDLLVRDGKPQHDAELGQSFHYLRTA